ncbi:hypothetical protein PPERSA_02845 [Pseudocohnilembus persalinus]|uniref:Uncharacterized protein n=1 Tax=Pseudocohnilembus persalinus TaxID=266149 RepID=A0A0V0QMX8_PSEPJ|nr:hypothetical protein PPERSA_02845 [Pseudocohnilembus persalinus]|eukprot:KRX03466.1 hypothetical protein PPERSA_02845 [Pseudocohnilembus persalinus]
MGCQNAKSIKNQEQVQKKSSQFMKTNKKETFTHIASKATLNNLYASTKYNNNSQKEKQIIQNLKQNDMQKSNNILSDLQILNEQRDDQDSVLYLNMQDSIEIQVLNKTNNKFKNSSIKHLNDQNQFQNQLSVNQIQNDIKITKNKKNNFQQQNQNGSNFQTLSKYKVTEQFFLQRKLIIEKQIQEQIKLEEYLSNQLISSQIGSHNNNQQNKLNYKSNIQIEEKKFLNQLSFLIGDQIEINEKSFDNHIQSLSIDQNKTRTKSASYIECGKNPIQSKIYKAESIKPFKSTGNIIT